MDYRVWCIVVLEDRERTGGAVGTADDAGRLAGPVVEEDEIGRAAGCTSS